MLEDIPRPVLEHFGELRRRVVRVLLLGAASLCVVSALPSLESSLAVRFFRAATTALLPAGTPLVFLDPLSPLWVALKSALALSAVVTGPYALYQALSFIAPALEARSRRWLVGSCAAAFLLFAAGAWVSWTLLIPVGLRLFFAVGAAAGATPAIDCERFFGFVLGMIVVGAAPFELPLVLLVLMKAGVLSPESLRAHRRLAYVAILVLAALITPDPTPLSQLVLSAVLIVFYEGATLAGALLRPGRAAVVPGEPGACPAAD